MAVLLAAISNVICFFPIKQLKLRLEYSIKLKMDIKNGALDHNRKSTRSPTYDQRDLPRPFLEWEKWQKELSAFMGKVLTVEKGEGIPYPQLFLRHPLSQRIESYEKEHRRTQKRGVIGLHYEAYAPLEKFECMDVIYGKQESHSRQKEDTYTNHRCIH